MNLPESKVNPKLRTRIDPSFGKSYWKRIDILSDVICEAFEPIEAVTLTNEEWERSERVVVDYGKRGKSSSLPKTLSFF